MLQGYSAEEVEIALKRVERGRHFPNPADAIHSLKPERARRHARAERNRRRGAITFDDLDQRSAGKLSALTAAAIEHAKSIRDGTEGSPKDKAQAVTAWWRHQMNRADKGLKTDIEALAAEAEAETCPQRTRNGPESAGEVLGRVLSLVVPSLTTRRTGSVP